MSTHTQRTLKYLRDLGYTCDIAEKWKIIKYRDKITGELKTSGVRVDLYGFIDILAIDDTRTIGVQSCGPDFAAHDRKILAEPRALKWVRAPGREAWLISWRKLLKKPGGKLRVWKPKIKEYTLEDFG